MRYLLALLFPLILCAQYDIGGRNLEELSGTTEQTDHKTVVVIEGDTLWELCEQHLGDPFLWPKVWAMNPELENPHIIEPGDKVHFFPRTGEIRIEPKGQKNVRNISNTNAFETEQNQAVQMAGHGNAVVGYNVSKQRNAERKKEFVLTNETMITRKQLKNSGKIANSPEEHLLLTKNDEVFLNFKGKHLNRVKVGDIYHVYRIRKKLKHPLRDRSLGYLVDILGEVKVTRKTRNRAVGVIYKALVEIERDDYVTPKINLDQVVSSGDTKKKIDGHVVDFAKEIDNIGERELVFIDKGKKDGLQKGMVFQVFRHRDPITNDITPPFVVGKVIVVSTNAHTATCYSIDAKTEIQKGDRISSKIIYQ